MYIKPKNRIAIVLAIVIALAAFRQEARASANIANVDCVVPIMGIERTLHITDALVNWVKGSTINMTATGVTKVNGVVVEKGFTKTLDNCEVVS